MSNVHTTVMANVEEQTYMSIQNESASWFLVIVMIIYFMDYLTAILIMLDIVRVLVRLINIVDT